MVIAMAALAIGLALVAVTLLAPREDEPKKIRIKVEDRNDRHPR